LCQNLTALAVKLTFQGVEKELGSLEAHEGLDEVVGLRVVGLEAQDNHKPVGEGREGLCEAMKRLIAEMPSAGRRLRRKSKLSASKSS
jgi:hypothetical protein